MSNQEMKKNESMSAAKANAAVVAQLISGSLEMETLALVYVDGVKAGMAIKEETDKRESA